jgi:hypothetical protein
MSGSGTDSFTLDGGKNVIATGSGHTTITIAGVATTTVLAEAGSSSITQSGGSLLAGIFAGTHQITVANGATMVLAVGGASTITAANAAPQVGLWAGDHVVNLSTAGGTVLQLGANATINGGSLGTAAIDLLAGQTQVDNKGSGLTELFVQGGISTLTAQQGGGNVLVAGYDPAHLAIDIPHGINGNNFTSVGQIPVAHDASGNVMIEVGMASNPSGEIILLAGTSSIGASAITLV